jgi:hypothetical protein
MWTNKMKAIWADILKFDPTQEHIDAWSRKTQKTVELEKYVSGLTTDRLVPLMVEGNKQKKEGKPVGSVTAQPLLKGIWRQVMCFPPTQWHLALLQRQIEVDLQLENYWKKVTVETLIEIVREVATNPPKPVVQPSAPQPQGAAKT